MTATGHANAKPQPSELQQAALQVLADSGTTYPSALAYCLIDRGALQIRNPRGRLKAQGAGFIGGKLLGDLRRAGWAICGARGWEISMEGRRALGGAAS